MALRSWTVAPAGIEQLDDRVTDIANFGAVRGGVHDFKVDHYNPHQHLAPTPRTNTSHQHLAPTPYALSPTPNDAPPQGLVHPNRNGSLWAPGAHKPLTAGRKVRPLTDVASNVTNVAVMVNGPSTRPRGTKPDTQKNIERFMVSDPVTHRTYALVPTHVAHRTHFSGEWGCARGDRVVATA